MGAGIARHGMAGFAVALTFLPVAAAEDAAGPLSVRDLPGRIARAAQATELPIAFAGLRLGATFAENRGRLSELVAGATYSFAWSYELRGQRSIFPPYAHPPERHLVISTRANRDGEDGPGIVAGFCAPGGEAVDFADYILAFVTLDWDLESSRARPLATEIEDSLRETAGRGSALLPRRVVDEPDRFLFTMPRDDPRPVGRAGLFDGTMMLTYGPTVDIFEGRGSASEGYALTFPHCARLASPAGTKTVLDIDTLLAD